MAAVVRRLKGVVRRRDDGFSLVEVIVALGLLAVVITPASLLFIRSMQSSKLDEQRQSATLLADEALETIRSRDASSLLNGRLATDVDNQWKNPGPIDLSQSNEPPLVNTTGTTVVPATPQTQVVGGVSYSVNTIVGLCYNAYDSASGTWKCGKTGTGIPATYRVAVSVTWNAGHGYKCATSTGLCSVVADTLVDPSDDPTFNNNT